MLPYDNKDYEKIKSFYETKRNFLKEKEKTVKKVLSRGPERERMIKMINLNFDPSKYKYKETCPKINTDKFYLLEKEYQKKGIPYSPFLMYTPEELIKNTQEKLKEDDFDYYKTHILLENYDEEPELPVEIATRLENMRNLSQDGHIYGYTKWFDTDGSRIWKKCRILEYDESTKMFHICVSNSSGRDINKFVTRFNFLFSGDSKEINLRVELAEKWKDYARKYMAFYHFVSSFTLEKIPNLINDSFMEKIFYLAFLYKGVSKPQLTPLELEELDNSQRFGIWRRHARKRQFEVEKKKLNKFYSTKNISNKEIEQIRNEIKENFDRSFKIMEFYKKLPVNYDLYMLLSDIIPKDRFLMSSEKYLYSKHNKGTLQIENRYYPYLKVFKNIQIKLPQSEYDMGPLLIEMNKRMEEDLRDKIFFYKNWFIKPIQLKDFKKKNRENIEVIFKECHFLSSNANYEIIKFLRERVKEAKKVNKGANISNEVIKKFREFQGLVNRKVATFTRELFHKSMDYMTEIFRRINKKVILVKPVEDMNIEDILTIRDDYNLEDYFTKSFDILQFYFEMNYSNGSFSIEPTFDKWWKSIEKITRKEILAKINKSSAISVYDLLSKEDQDNYYIDKENNLIVFYEDDTSYEEELIILKNEMQKFFSLIIRFCDLLNIELKNNISELISFSKDIKSKNYDEESLNIETFRHFINMNSKYITFFQENFKYEYFFLGGNLINTNTIKEIWLNRLNDIKDLIFKLIIDNNVYLSQKIEEEKDIIEKKLEQEPQTVDEYDSLVKYCENLNNQLTGIWKKIDSQQMNADLLEENFFTMKKEDFFRMWSCYGIPRYLYYKKQDTVSRLVSDRKKFKQELKQKYLTTLQDISKLRSDYESSTVISDIENFEKSFYTFSDLNYRIEKMIKHCSTLNDHQVIIGIKVTDLSEIKEIYSSFINYYQLWEAVYNFESSKITWMNDSLKKIDRKALKNTYDTCQSTIDKLEKTVFRKDKPAPNQIIQLLREKIREFQPFLPILYDLINPDFKPNHINDLSKSIGVEIPDDLNINMQELISRGITDHIDGINERSSYATGQKKLASNLEKFKERYKSLKLDSMFFKDTDLLVLKDTDPVSEEIDQLLTKVVSMSSSKFAKYLQKDIQALWQNLAKSQEVIDIWLKVQKLIQQQQQIFVFGDLKKQLQEEVSKYDFVEKQWRGVMDQLKFSSLVSEICIVPKIKEIFVKSLQTLEEVNKSLNAYLNTKRDVFPRFYFVSNEELIMMLAQCGDPKIIATNYIQQVFEGMKKLEITSREEVVVVNIGNPSRAERNSNLNTLNDSQHTFNEDMGSSTHPNQETHTTNRVVNTYSIFESMISEQGELVKFNNVINPHEDIYVNNEKITKAVALEKWLIDLENEMINTLKSKFLDCYKNLTSKEISREEWAGQHIEQAILTMSQMDWTKRTSEVITAMSTGNINSTGEMQNSNNQNSLKELYEYEKQSLLNLIKKIRSKDNSKLLKKTLVSLIIQDVHANDVISYLIENDVNSLTAFEWISQLRYYFLTAKGKPDEILGINVRMLNTERAYDYEYLGNQKRLVITPLTDRCYRTMMEALNNCLGGAPEGPAGTGKTETIKDLSKNLGKKCFTYNCSEESDYVLMTKFFKGIAMSGCWICFDEFNRISVDVLSVIAYQISILLNALKNQSISCVFEGATIPFNNNMGVFITMNPDYAGRSDLPDNLKGLFRPLAMMIPNYDMITEIMLYSFGFNKARNLSRKIVSSLRLASEQLSSQTHYDYGMRTLNGIINYIGILSAERNQSENETDHEIDTTEYQTNENKNMSSEEVEEYIVQKAIRDSNMPKFIADDYKIYEGILSDLFPNGEFFNKSDDNLNSCIVNQMRLLKLTDSDFLISKVVDFNNIMSVRHAIMIVGEPMAHKSTILKIYLEAITEYFKNQNLEKGVKYNIINPKSITSAQLFGYVNKKSMDFYEGVCSKVLRDYFADLSNDLKFLVLDGPVDTMWIENMNSVLDDTKKLCLENSDQIRLDDKTFIIFEVDDLSQASLATISRCGMVYTDRNNIRPSDYFTAWIKSFPDSYHETNYLDLIKSLFDNFYEPLVDSYLFNEYNTLLYKVNLPIHKNWLMKSFINILESLLFTQQTKSEITENEIEKMRLTKEQAETQVNSVEDSYIYNRKVSTLRARVKKSVSKTERFEIFNKFIYSILVTICWILESPKDQKNFIEKIFEISKDIMNVPSFILKEELLHFTKNFLGKDFTDFLYNTHDNQWIQISEYISNSRDLVINKFRDNINNESIVIPTVQTYKAYNIVKHCQHSSHPILFFGHTASGKSLLMKDYLITNSNFLNENNWISYTFILNSKTSANNMCDLLEEKISFKLKKNTVAPPNYKKALILIEDLNMPVKEKYGAQPPIEILRQFFDYGGWYDRKEKDFLYLKNLLIFSFITVGRPLVSGRLLWHHIPFPMTEMDDITLKDIYSTYFNGKFFNYPQTVRKLQASFVEIIVNTYKSILKSFRPLPATPHYCYNVRDLNKLFEGLTMVKQEVISTRMDIPDYMLNLLLHETMRIFGDRLINDSDRTKFMNSILNDMHKNLKQHITGSVNSQIINYDMVLFTEINDDQSYQKVSNSELLKECLYKYIEDYNCNKKSKDKMDLILFDYSLKHLLRIDRILTRSNEHGVLIGLTGSGRQSLTYVASFIKNYKVLQTRSRDQVDDYSRKEWLEDIKNLYSFAGLRREDSVFMVKDNNIPEESMYVDLNCIISSGIVYNLFTNDEKSEWLGNIRQMKEYEDLGNLDDQAVWEIFLQRTLQKIRIILCMNPLNQNFTKILRSFPALINNTSIDWYEEWPESALFYLAQREFSKIEIDFSKEVILNENLKDTKLDLQPLSSEISDSNLPSSRFDKDEYNERMLNILSKIFSKSYTLLTNQNEEYIKQTRKKVILLPKSYLDFINFFKSHYEFYKSEVDKKIKKYSDGVKKIEEADIEIKKMKETLEIKKPLLVEKGKYIETTIKDIEAQTKEAEEFAKQCEENERIAFDKRQQAEYKKLVAEKNKAEAEILKEEIFKKIMQIDNKQFMALRSFRNPPKEVTKMMQAISIIMSNWDKKPMDVVPQEWEFFKKKLNDVKLLKQLESLAKKLESSLLQDKVVKLLETFVSDPDLDPAFMEKKISSTCACFCVYFKNMYVLDDLLKNKIIPSIKEAESATQIFTEAQENLDIQKRNLREVEQKLNALKASFNEKNHDKLQLEIEISETQKKLIRAERLTSSLKSEKKRWKEISEDEEKNKKFLFGDIIISTIYITFMGPYLNFFREDFIKNFIFPLLNEEKILYKNLFSVSKIIGNPFKIQDWIINGLPSDNGSIDNAIILFETNKQVLFIDPQKQAMSFLNKLYKQDFCIFKKAESLSGGTTNSVKEAAANFSFIENCIKNGKILIFDYISFDICSEADMLLNSEIVNLQNGKVLRMNDQDISLHPKFKFYLVSYLENPSFNPDLYGKISIINFSVTKSGLSEQLLSVIVKEESPKDELERITILQNRFILEETINKMESQILEKLNVSSETLLDNDALIVNLEESKKLSDEAQLQINSAKITEEKLEHFRMFYQPLANLSTLIFFTISELNFIEDIYQFSISWFIKDILINSIKSENLKDSTKDTNHLQTNKNISLSVKIEKRVETLTKSLLEKAYVAVCRSLLNKDKLLFSFLILLKKLISTGELLDDEMQFLLSDNIKSTSNSSDEASLTNLRKLRPEYLDVQKWERIIKINQIESYKGIAEEICTYNTKQWKKYITQVNPGFDFPKEYNDKNLILNNLSPIKKLLLIKIINLESLNEFIKIVISQYFNSEELSRIPLFTINDLVEMSNFSTPLMMIMTSGIDPSGEVKRIAEENNKELVTISLGQGQAKKALANIDLCQKKGFWVFLQNLHLVPDFMKNLEQIISNLQSDDKSEIDQNFRLWLSTLPTNNILPSILVNSLKITLESPVGVKANLIKLLKSQNKIWSYDLDGMKRVNKEYEFSKFFISLMHFHSILLERKNYGPLGWNVKYSFNESDFLISKMILKNNLEKHSLAIQQGGNVISLPYKALIYLTADCIYGGRVTDDWDRRTLFSILEDFYNDTVIHEDMYMINQLPEYKIEYYETVEEYFNQFNSLPESQNPEVLGLHKNALIRKQMEESSSLLIALSGLDKNESSQSSGSSKVNILYSIFENVNKKLVRSFNIEDAKKKYPIKYEDCMNSILIQEIMRYNSLLNLVFKSINETLQAFQGLLPLTDSFEEIAQQLISNRTPSHWIKSSYPSRKPIGSWINDLADRLNFFSNWINTGTPEKFWISAFYFTQSFLTGIKQNFARKYKVSIDKLEFNFLYVDNKEIEEESTNNKIKKDGYFTYGLYIEGARWNSDLHCVDELKGKNLNDKLPPIILTVKDITINSSKCDIMIDNKEKHFIYQCPVYKCSSRHGSLSTTGHSTNYIFTIDLPSTVIPKHWVKRGVALLNQLDD